jgi:hypothetical protein
MKLPTWKRFLCNIVVFGRLSPETRRAAEFLIMCNKRKKKGGKHPRGMRKSDDPVSTVTFGRIYVKTHDKSTPPTNRERFPANRHCREPEKRLRVVAQQRNAQSNHTSHKKTKQTHCHTHTSFKKKRQYPKYKCAIIPNAIHFFIWHPPPVLLIFSYTSNNFFSGSHFAFMASYNARSNIFEKSFLLNSTIA